MHSSKQPSSRLHTGLHTLWNTLTRPTEAIQGDYARQKSQLLAALLLGLIAAAFLRVIVPGLFFQFPRPLSKLEFWNALIGSLVLLVLYWLSRRYPYLLLARLAVFITSMAIFMFSLPHRYPNNIDIHIYLILPVLISSILLPTAETAVLIMANTIGMMLFPLLFDNTSWNDIWLLPVTLASVTVLALFHYLIRVEQQRQKKLQDNIAQTRALLTAFPDIIFHMSADGIYLDYETGDLSQLYRAPEDFKNQHVRDIMPPDIAENTLKRVQKALDTGQVQTSEYSLTINDQVQWFEARTIPLEDHTVLTVVRDITERRDATRALQQSEETRLALIDALPDLIFRFDRAGNFLDYKPAKIGLMLPESAFLGKNIREAMPYLADQTLNAIEQALNTGKPQIFEYQLPYEDVLHTYEARISPIGPKEAVAIVRDITSQRENQRALRASEARYRALFENSPISLWEEDFSAVKTYLDELIASGVTDDLATYFYQNPDIVRHCASLVKILNVNQATLDFMGIDVKDTLLDSLKPILDEEWHRLFRRELVAFSKGIHHYVSETAQRSINGERVHALIGVVIAPGYEDTWERVYVSIVDITERKRTEQALLDSENQLELVLDGAELGLWDWDLATNTMQYNRWWAAMLGYGPDEVAPYISTWDNALHPNDRERVWAAHHAHIDGYTSAYESEYRLRAKDGQWVWVLDRGKVVERDASGGPLRMVGTHLDITQRKEVEDAEREQRTLAEALREISAVLSSTLDLNEVLNHILTTIERVVPHEASSIALLENGVARVVRSKGYTEYGIEHSIDTLSLRVADTPTLQFMINTQKPLLIPNIHADSMWKKLDVTTMMHSYMGAPIVWDDKVAGFIGLQSTAPHFFTPKHAERLHVFADQAAIALRNAQWYNVAQSRLAEMEVLHKIMLEITGQLNFDALLELLVKYALQLINAPAGGIYLHLPDEDVLEWTAAVGVDSIPIKMRLQRGEGLSGKVWERGEPMIINDYLSWEHRLPHLKAAPFRNILAVPIMWQNHLLGVVNAATNTDQHTFDDHDIWLMSLFANQAAIAIQNARLFNAEFQQRALAESLRDTVAAINSTLQLDELLERLLNAVQRVIPYDAANIMLLDDDAEYAYNAHFKGYTQHNSAEYMRNLRVRVDKWPGLHNMITTGKGFMIQDTRTDKNWTHRDESDWVSAIIAVPIRDEKRVIGTLNLDNSEPHSFTRQNLEHAQAFADQAAVALKNARLYAEVSQRRDDLEQRVRERTRDLSVRNAVAETLSSSLDINEMITGVLNVVARQLNVHGGAIYLPNNDREMLVTVASYGTATGTLARHVPLPKQPTPDNLPLMEILTTLPDTSSQLSIPIWQKDQVEGVIILTHDQPRQWHENEKRMLDAIGRQIGVALANAQSYTNAVEGEAHIRTILQSVADGLLVFDNNDELLLMNSAAQDMLSFYAMEEGGEQRAASLLWHWLREHETASSDPVRIEFALPVNAVNDDDRAIFRTACEVHPCTATHSASLSWPCWLRSGRMRSEDLKQCALYNQVRRLAIQAQSAAVRDDNGTILGTVVVLNDVTHFHELDQLKGQFVSTVSHELRTPLSAILLQVSTLLKYYDRFEESERHTMIMEIQEQSQVLRKLIEDILELSRFDANRSLPQKQWFDLVAACREVRDSLQLAIRNKNLTIDAQGCAGSRYIMGDSNQIKRVLRNLFSNAIKYTPDSGMITISLQQEGTETVLRLTDTGIGIEPDDLPHIFERFFRTDNAASMAAGTGLGLPITKEIVELHGGRIDVESEVGKGSTFTVWLPVGGLNMLGR